MKLGLEIKLMPKEKWNGGTRDKIIEREGMKMASLGNYIEKLCHDITVKLNDDIDNIIIKTSRDIFGATSIKTEIEMNDKWIISAITEKLEREENKPLTIEELRGMVGEPVWVERINAKGASRWFVLTAVDGDDNTLVGDSDCFIFGEPYLKFYKHKPKGDDLYE